MCYVILSSILRKTVSHYISVNTNDDGGTRPNARALTVHHSPTQEEYASDQEQMCSGSKDQHSIEG